MNAKLTFGAVIGIAFGLVLSSSQLAYAGGPAADPCSLLTQAQVSAALGVNVDPAKRVGQRMCEWSAPNQPNSIRGKKVALLTSDANAFAFAKAPVVNGETAVPANGVCDDAVYSFPTGNKSGFATALYVKKGSSYFTVHVNGFPEQAKAMAIEKALALNACTKL